ncbi:gustatory receptor for sugar taste 43a-like [Cydia pomonella]|uniref:gustatory receptor for sugar taste 43a-like n=1 Tax=Cydia pomonella TaxID=82600 RepID=UPI002ADD4441|nr:gustatory receptor for sugar taste 43a-like [Cydia pomonella]
MTLLNAAIITSIILDFYQEPEKRLRVGATFLKTVIWLTEIALVMGIASLAVYTGPAQVECLKRVLKQLQKINSDLNLNNPSAKTEKIKSIIMVILLTWVVFIMIMDVVFYYPHSLEEGTVCILCLQLPFYVAHLLWWQAVLRWALTVEAVHGAAATVNHRLQSIRLATMKPVSMKLDEFLSKPRSIGTLLNCIRDPALTAKTTELGIQNFTYPAQVKTLIRCLALSYERIGDIMRQMNETNGLLLMIILTTTFMKLVVTPYYMLIYALDDESNVVFDVMLSLNWSLAILAILVLTIEPCHRVHSQRERTEVLVRQLTAHLAPSRQLSKELEQFTKLIVLNKPRFTALGIYTLDRPLMAMMLSGITTYLVIIIQFQKFSHKLEYD